MKKPLTTVLIKPSGPSCNLHCAYCFYLKKSGLFEGNHFRMTDDLLEELIIQAMEQAGREITFIWQGGEPSLMGIDFFKKAVEYQVKYGNGKLVGNGFQTNGTLLNDEWAAFLSKYNFLTGLSLDGPKEIHDHYRKFNNQKGSWQDVMKAYEKLKQAGVSVNALATVTKYSSMFPTESYRFFKQLNFEFIQYIPVLETNDQGIEDFSVPAGSYGNFLSKIWKLWYQDFLQGNAPNIRTFEAIFGNYVGLGASECTYSRECGSYLVVEHNGDVYPCDYFVEPGLKLGNIKTSFLSEMLNSMEQKEFGLQKARKSHECDNCKYYNYCYGGCPKYRIVHKNGKDQNFFCTAYQRFFDEADEILQGLRKQWIENATRNRAGKYFDATGYFG